MFASPAVDANTNKFRIQSWLRVPGNDERTFCWVTQPGTAEDHVAMHFEAASNVATTESIVEPLYTVRQRHMQPPTAGCASTAAGPVAPMRPKHATR